MDGVPCFTRLTAIAAASKSTWVHCRSHSSEARSPCRNASRIMVWSRCGRRLPLHPSISCSTSRSVRYSRVLTSAFLGRRGVTFRILVFGDTTRKAVFIMVCRASSELVSVHHPNNGKFSRVFVREPGLFFGRGRARRGARSQRSL